MKYLIHFLLALFLRPIIAMLAFPYTIIKLIVQGEFAELAYWFHQLAFMLDLFGNYLIKYIGTDLVLKKDSNYLYGRSIKTISHVTAFNYNHNNLTGFGNIIARIMIICKDKSFKKTNK
jgi:hypothetical protein